MANKVHTDEVGIGKKRKKNKFINRSVVFIEKRNDVYSWDFHSVIEINENKRP